MFEWLFKYPGELFEQGSLTFTPLLDLDSVPWIAAALAVALLVSVVLGARLRSLGPGRRLTLGALQALFVLGVLVVLARPTLEVATLTPGANTVALLVDVSESMGLPAEDVAGSRLDAARAVLRDDVLPALAGLAEVTTFAFGEAALRRGIDELAATEPHTRLVESLETVLAGFSGAPLAAVVVLSDGADNAGTPDLAALRGGGVPVHTVGIGPHRLPGEVELADVTLPAQAPPNSRVVAQVTVRHDGAGAATLKVRDGGRLLSAHDVQLDAQATARRVAVDFDSGPGGIRELTFEVERADGDRLAENNRLERLLTVSDRQRRVLYLEGEPRWEYKFIRRALGGDDVLAVTSWLRTTDRKTYRQDVQQADELEAGFPATLAELYGYDVIVLGSLAAAYLDEAQHAWLESFVGERGGSLLALAGREALADGGWDVKPLADVLPVTLVREPAGTYGAVQAGVRPTRAGAGAAMVQLAGGEGADPWSSLPPLGDYQRLGALKPAATALLAALIDGQPQPLLVLQPYGLGTSAVLATATTWRWRMRTPADDARHTLFWRQLVRQLAETAQQPRDLSLRVDNDAVIMRLAERDATFAPRPDVRASATVTGPGRDADRIELAPTASAGVLTARFQPPAPGVYRVDVAVDDVPEALTRFVRVGAQSPEYFGAVQNAALLQRIAEATGGRYWRPEQAGDMVRALTFGSAGVTHRERFPLWDMPAVFLLLVLLKGGEWLLRRRWGRI